MSKQEQIDKLDKEIIQLQNRRSFLKRFGIGTALGAAAMAGLDRSVLKSSIAQAPPDPATVISGTGVAFNNISFTLQQDSNGFLGVYSGGVEQSCFAPPLNTSGTSNGTWTGPVVPNYGNGIAAIAGYNTPSCPTGTNTAIEITDNTMILGNMLCTGFLRFGKNFPGSGLFSAYLSYDTQNATNPFTKYLVYNLESAPSLTISFTVMFHVLQTPPLTDPIEVVTVNSTGTTTDVLFNAFVYCLFDPNQLTGLLAKPTI